MGKAVGIDLGTTYSCVGVWQNVSLFSLDVVALNASFQSTHLFIIILSPSLFLLSTAPLIVVVSFDRFEGREDHPKLNDSSTINQLRMKKNLKIVITHLKKKPNR